MLRKKRSATLKGMTTFTDYYNALNQAQRQEIARRAGTKAIYLYQIAAGIRRPSPAMAKKLHEASGFVVPLHGLRPDVWDAASVSPQRVTR